MFRRITWKLIADKQTKSQRKNQDNVIKQTEVTNEPIIGRRAPPWKRALSLTEIEERANDYELGIGSITKKPRRTAGSS